MQHFRWQGVTRMKTSQILFSILELAQQQSWLSRKILGNNGSYRLHLILFVIQEKNISMETGQILFSKYKLFYVWYLLIQFLHWLYVWESAFVWIILFLLLFFPQKSEVVTVDHSICKLRKNNLTQYIRLLFQHSNSTSLTDDLPEAITGIDWQFSERLANTSSKSIWDSMTSRGKKSKYRSDDLLTFSP